MSFHYVDASIIWDGMDENPYWRDRPIYLVSFYSNCLWYKDWWGNHFIDWLLDKDIVFLHYYSYNCHELYFSCEEDWERFLKDTNYVHYAINDPKNGEDDYGACWHKSIRLADDVEKWWYVPTVIFKK